MTNTAREARALVAAVGRRFRSPVPFAELFARSKLTHDPIYLGLLARGAIPSGASVLDLGCGQGILLCLLAEASDRKRSGAWPSEWPAPPEGLRLIGIEASRIAVRRARRALGSDGSVEEHDLRVAELATSDVIALLDVVHYLEPAAQERLLERVAGALNPGGVVLMRVCADSSGTRARFTRTTDRFGALTRGHFVWQLHVRGVAAWLGALERLGLRASVEPASQGTPFANVLISARRAR